MVTKQKEMHENKTQHSSVKNITHPWCMSLYVLLAEVPGVAWDQM